MCVGEEQRRHVRIIVMFRSLVGTENRIVHGVGVFQVTM